jgi:hypothetical protein
MKERMKRKHLFIWLTLALPTLHAGASHAQAAPGGGMSPGGATPSTPGNGTSGTAPAPAPGGQVQGAPAPGSTAPSAPPGGAIYAPPYGLPTGPFTDQNAHLPSSSQPSNDTSRSSDHFDLGTSGGPSVFRGGPNSAYAGPATNTNVEVAELTPQVHVVRRGDTLWDLCDRYFHNPWDWPRIWSYNPGLQNPHWIYPGDQIRMEPGAPSNAGAPPGTAAPSAGQKPLSRFQGRVSRVAPNTIFLRDQGYIDDTVKDVWGEVGGSPDDQLLLSEGDNSYIDMKPGHEVSPGDELTVFRPLKSNLRGDAKGTLVAILGTARVDKYDPQTRIARAKLTESLDVIERGSFVGPVRRRFEVVPPVRNEVELWGHVAASLYPHVLYGQNQVVFIDRGAQDGLVPGNRLFVVTRGDEYRKTLPGASEFAASHVQYENEEPAKVIKGGALGTNNDAKYPEEVIGEIRVLSVREHTAACLVIASGREIEPAQRVVARRGY